MITRYLTTNVPVANWKAQGTVYDTKMEAVYASAKLYTAYNIKQVAVNKTKDGKFTLKYSRF